MARPSYGDDVKARVRQLLDRFLAYANDELDCQPFKNKPNWQESKQVVIVRTNLRELAELTGLETKHIREVLKRLQDFLGILERFPRTLQ